MVSDMKAKRKVVLATVLVVAVGVGIGVGYSYHKYKFGDLLFLSQQIDMRIPEAETNFLVLKLLDEGKLDTARGILASNTYGAVLYADSVEKEFGAEAVSERMKALSKKVRDHFNKYPEKYSKMRSLLESAY
jgi:hypothetical protein